MTDVTSMYCIAGGVLFIVTFYTTEDGQNLGETKGGKNLYQVMQTIWKQIYLEGKITKVNDGARLEFK